MWNSPLQIDKYQYARTNPYLVKFIGLLGIITTLLMGYGFYNYLQLTSIYALTFGPIALIMVTNKLLRYTMQLFYQKFDVKKHEQFINEYWTKHHEPSVNVFLPWAGEDLKVHEEVLKAVKQFRYTNYRVFMLDDAGSNDHRLLADKYGYTYLSRPNKGVYKKSGNLQYGYENSAGEYIFILDADVVPTPDALHDLIPYIASDDAVGILQTPQYFEQTTGVHTRSKIEYGGGNIVEEFYKINMPSRDEFKAAMCVGTSAVYRRTAIEKLDGTPKVHASEDMATGLLVTQHGYYVKYLPLIVSIGKSPETYQGYFKQHMRWCSGNLVFAKYWPQAKLNVMARLIYLTNPMYYLSEALTVVFSFQFLALLYFHPESLSLTNTLYFLPYVLFSRMVIPLTKTNKNRVGTKLAALNNSYTYIYTYLSMLFKGVPVWHPTGKLLTGVQPDFLSAINLGTFISSLFISLLLYVLLANPNLLGNYHTYIILGWSFYSAFWHAAYLFLVSKFVYPFQRASVQSFSQRAYLYAKTHLLLVLYFSLIGAAIVNTSIALQNPTSPTLLAFHKLRNSVSPNSDIAIVTPIAPTSLNILGDSVVKPYETQFYTYMVQHGDTMEMIAEKAVEEYVATYNVHVATQSSIQIAAVLVNSAQEDTELTPGEEVSVEESLISAAINLATESGTLDIEETAIDPDSTAVVPQEPIESVSDPSTSDTILPEPPVTIEPVETTPLQLNAPEEPAGGAPIEVVNELDL